MLKDSRTAFRVAAKLPEGVANKQGHIGIAKEIKISVEGRV
jgi:hypothetical protein